MRYLFYFLLLFSGIVHAEDRFNVKDVFDKANALYRNEKYEEAVAVYESIPAKYDVHSAELYFNLANAYYKMNRVGPAVYNYEKALLINPDDTDVRNNLKFAHNMMIDEVVEMPKVGFAKVIGNFTSSGSPDFWGWLAVFCAVLFFASFCGYYFSGRTLYKRIFFLAMCFFALGLLIAVSAAIFEKDRLKNERPAIVFAGIASVKGEPKQSAADGSVLHEGTKVYVLETLENWKRVLLPDGSDGWMSSTDIKELK